MYMYIHLFSITYKYNKTYVFSIFDKGQTLI